jgi:hypothetical protein
MSILRSQDAITSSLPQAPSREIAIACRRLAICAAGDAMDGAMVLALGAARRYEGSRHNG